MACIRYVAPKGDNKVRHFAGQLKNGSDDVLSSQPASGGLESPTIHITTPKKTPACGGVDSPNIHITTPKKTPSISTPWDIFITSKTGVTEVTSQTGGASWENPGCVKQTPHPNTPHQHTLPQHTPPAHIPPQHTPHPNTPPQHTLPQHTTPAHIPPQHSLPQHTPPAHIPPQHTPHPNTPPQHTLPQNTPPAHIAPQHTPPSHTSPSHTLLASTSIRIKSEPIRDNTNGPCKKQTIKGKETSNSKVIRCGLNTHTNHTTPTNPQVCHDDLTSLDQATAHFSTKDSVRDQQPLPDDNSELSQLGADSTSGLNKTGNASHHNRLSNDVIDLDEEKDVVQNITQRSGPRSSRCNNNQQLLNLSQGPYRCDNKPLPGRQKPLPGGHKLLPGRSAIKRSISDMALEGRDQLSFFGYTGGDRSYRSYGVGDLDDDDDEWCIDLDQILEQVRSKSHTHRPASHAHRPARNGWGNVILTQMGGSEHELKTASPQNEGQHGGSLTSRSDSGVTLVSDRLRTRRFALADPERMIMRQEDRERIEQEVERRRQSIVRRVSQFFNVQLGLNREEDLI